MNELANIDLDQIEPYMLSLGGSASCPVVHHFGPGIYVREVTLPKGIMALGHKQRFEHLNIVLKGSVAVYDEGRVHVIQGPTIFVGKPGRKIGVCIEECVWQNVYANPDNERDIAKLEERYLEKSPIALAYERISNEEDAELFEEDRKDFSALAVELGISEDQIRKESENESDIVDLPDEYATRVSVRSSPIEGKGLFLSSPAAKDEIIAIAKIGDCRTIAGRFVNHSLRPNCKYVRMNGDIYLVATQDIDGCDGGSHGTELTVDYREAARLSGRIEE